MFRERMQMVEFIGGRVTDALAPAAANCMADSACPHRVPTSLLPLVSVHDVRNRWPCYSRGRPQI